MPKRCARAQIWGDKDALLRCVIACPSKRDDACDARCWCAHDVRWCAQKIKHAQKMRVQRCVPCAMRIRRKMCSARAQRCARHSFIHDDDARQNESSTIDWLFFVDNYYFDLFIIFSLSIMIKEARVRVRCARKRGAAKDAMFTRFIFRCWLIIFRLPIIFRTDACPLLFFWYARAKDEDGDDDVSIICAQNAKCARSWWYDDAR